MEIPSALLDFLTTAKDISIGYSELTYCKHKEIAKEQVGYRIDPDGNDLTGDNDGDWKKCWIVFGWDSLEGDPFFIDANLPALPVFTAMHGMGSWTPIPIADSLENYKIIISNLKRLSKGRTSPVAMERNPISDSEREAFLSSVRQTNLHADIEYWELLIKQDLTED